MAAKTAKLPCLIFSTKEECEKQIAEDTTEYNQKYNRSLATIADPQQRGDGKWWCFRAEYTKNTDEPEYLFFGGDGVKWL